MRIFECTTFFDKNLMLEVRFNILNKHVDKFVVAEAKYSRSGDKKKLNFDIKNLAFLNLDFKVFIKGRICKESPIQPPELYKRTLLIIYFYNFFYHIY